MRRCTVKASVVHGRDGRVSLFHDLHSTTVALPPAVSPLIVAADNGGLLVLVRRLVLPEHRIHATTPVIPFCTVKHFTACWGMPAATAAFAPNGRKFAFEDPTVHGGAVANMALWSPKLVYAAAAPPPGVCAVTGALW